MDRGRSNGQRERERERERERDARQREERSNGGRTEQHVGVAAVVPRGVHVRIEIKRVTECGHGGG